MPFTFPPTIYSEYPTNAPAILSIVAGKDGNVSFFKTSFCKDKRKTSDRLWVAVAPPTQINPFSVEIVTP